MKIIEVDWRNPAQVKDFLALPFRLYRNTIQWVPPLAQDAQLQLDRQHFPYFQHSEAAFFLIYGKDEKYAIGRIAVLEPRLYNQYNRERTAFFYLFECEDSPEAAIALFETAFLWARQRNLDHLLGPKGFTALDGHGLLVQGYAHRPALGIPYNPQYYANLIEAAGFYTEFDTLSGYLDASAPFPEHIHRASQLVQRRRGLKIKSFQNRSDLRPLVSQLKDLYNGALSGTRYNAPITDAEVKTMADQILWFADPKLIKIITKDDEMVGFLLAYPDISAAIQRCQGRLLPFGWADMLLELKRTKWININGAGMVEKYRGLGGPAILFSEMYKSVAESHYHFADLVQIGTENEAMQRELRDLGIDFYKKHRVYNRRL